MAKRLKLDFSDLAAYRKDTNLNQTDFWRRIGITQSGGCRYEHGRAIPVPVRMLLWLYDSGRVTDDDLEKALKAVGQTRR